MTATTFGLLACIGVIALILNSEIRRVQRNLDESIRNQQRVFPKVQQLESEIAALKRGMKGMQREIDRLKPKVVEQDSEEDYL